MLAGRNSAAVSATADGGHATAKVVLFNPGSVVTTRYLPRGRRSHRHGPARAEEQPQPNGTCGEPDAGTTRTSGSGGRHGETGRAKPRHRAPCRPHHDVELMDAAGAVLARAAAAARAWPASARLHAHDRRAAGASDARARSSVAIETDRGPWVAALIAAGYQVYRGQPAAGGPVPGTARRCRGPRATPPTRTCWPTWSAPTRTSCARSPPTADLAEAVKVVARDAQDADLGAHPARAAAAARAARVLPGRAGGLRRPGRPRHPGAAAKAPDPASAARLTRSADLRRAQARRAAATSRRKADAIQAALRSPQLAQPPAVTAAYAAVGPGR